MSNARFVNKGLHRGSDYATLKAMIDYFENGGTITVCKTGKRSKANTSFPQIHGTVASRGRKSETLRKSGIVSIKKG